MHRWRFLALVSIAGLTLAACTPGGVASPTGEATGRATAEETEGASPSHTEGGTEYDAMTYPEDGPADCDAEGYTGEFSQIRAVDALTVEFTLCQADVAFLQKIAFSAFGINDSDYLEANTPELGDDGTPVAEGSIVENPNGTGPFRFAEWARGDHITLEGNPDYWGDAASTQTLIFRWSEEGAQRLLELQSGTSVDGIDNPAPDDFETIEGDPNLALYPRDPMNVFYLGMNNTYEPWNNEQVRQAIAMGIDRERIVSNYYPAPSEVADYFTPCFIPGGCEGDPWYEFDPEGARELLADAGFPDGFDTVIQYRDVFRAYLPEPPVVAQEIQTQLLENLNIRAEIEPIESGTYLDMNTAGELEGLFMLGWGADYPDQTNFLDYHFGQGAGVKFGDIYEDLADVLAEAATETDADARLELYAEANNLVREHVPMVPVAHGYSATAFLADVEGAHASPLNNELFAGMKAGDRDQLVFMQNAEPPGLYCADETDGEAFRVCIQMLESLYSYEIGGTEIQPSLATECTSDEDEVVWTCTLRDGVTFHDGSELDANDVVVSYAVQWDAEHPLHVGRTSAFEYFPGLFGGFLNPPAEE
ncbi:MAG: ABC transporter substrate-binding protein [Candidatus Limnocylindria bacterium]